MKRIKYITITITIPDIAENSVFEVDEIKTFIGKKKNHIWIAYALNRKDNRLPAFQLVNELLKNWILLFAKMA